MERLHHNRDRWEQLGIRDYDFEYRKSCFCPVELTNLHGIEVRAGVVVRVVNRLTGQVVSTGPTNLWPTIDSLFAQTERNFGYGYKLKITYDGAYHFPAYVSGDIPMAVDDEFTLWAEALTRR